MEDVFLVRKYKMSSLDTSVHLALCRNVGYYKKYPIL